MQEPLLDAAEQAVATLVEASRELLPIIVVGAPLRARDRSRIFNCAVIIHHGEILGIAPKQNLPTYREFYERRWSVAPGDDADGVFVRILGEDHELTPHSIITVDDVPGLRLFVEICEDMWVPVPPSAEAALAGATVIANLSGSPITVGRAEDRKLLARSASARCQAAYIYAAAGEGESTTDLAWDGQTFVYECGDLLGESERFPQGPRATIVDVDLDRIVAERRRQNTVDDNRRTHAESLEKFSTWHEAQLFGPFDEDFEDIDEEDFDEGERTRRLVRHSPLSGRRQTPTARSAARPLHRFPFVPDDPARLAQDSYEAFSIQVAGAGASAERDRRRQARRHAPRARRLRRSGLHACAAGVRTGDGSAGSRPLRDPRLHDARLRDHGAHPLQRRAALAGDRGELRDDRHPSCLHPDAEGHGAPRRQRRGGLRRDLRERAGRHALRLPVPPREPSRRHRGGHRRPLRAGAGLVHLRRGRPDVPLRRERGRAQDADPAPDPLGRRRGPVRRRDRRPAAGRARHRDLPGADPHQAGGEGAVHRGLDRPLRAARLHALPPAAPRLRPREDRLPRPPGLG